MSGNRAGRNLPMHGGRPGGGGGRPGAGEGRGRGGDRGGNRGGGGRGSNVPKEPDVDPNILYKAPIPDVDPKIESFENQCVAKNKGQRASTGELALRPDYGSNGTRVIVRSNFFEAVFNSPKWLSHKVKIVPEPQNARLRREVFIELMGKKPIQDAHAATDGAQEVVSMQNLTQHSPMKITVDANLKGAKDFEVQLSLGEPGEPSELVRKLQNPSLRQQTPDELTTIRLMNILMSAHPFRDKGVTTIKGPNGTKVFWTDKRSTACYLGGGIECIRGYNSSVRVCDNRILVNLGINHSSFFLQGPLVNILTKFSEIHGYDNVLLNRYINRLRVDVTHLSKRLENGMLFYRQRSIWGLAWPGRDGYDQRTKKPIDANPPRFSNGAGIGATADQTSFFKYERDKYGKDLPTGQYITVTQFFKEEHNMNLQYNKWPLVNIGSFIRPIYLPLDVCIVPAGQRFMGELALIQRQNIIAFSCRKPPANYQSITTDGLNIMGMDNNKTDEIGIRFKTAMIAVQGRILPAPTLRYGDNKKMVPKFGSWNMKGQKFFRGATINSWLGCVFHRQNQKPRESDQELKNAFNAFSLEGRKLGMRWPDLAGFPKLVEIQEKHPNDGGRPDRPQDWIERINGIFKSLRDRPPDLLVILLPPGVERVFDHIKWISETKTKVMTHCCLTTKFLQGGDQYLANNAMKVNLKLGGVNQTLQAAPRLIQSGNTMVVGLDVTHPSPTDPELFPSMATIVATTDSLMGQWPGEVRIQERRKETILFLKSMMINCLERWKGKNGVYPTNIMIYRDGVSEGQYKMVLVKELVLVKNAVQAVYRDKQPNITIVVAGKRHNVRFYQTRAVDGDRCDGPKNGLVVDRGVTRPIYWDFYMQAQTPLQGSARPAHYIVIWDEIFSASNSDPKPADSLQALTHDICYMMGRCTRSIGYATPAFLADKYCDRARRYLRAYFYRCAENRVPVNLEEALMYTNAHGKMAYI